MTRSIKTLLTVVAIVFLAGIAGGVVGSISLSAPDIIDINETEPYSISYSEGTITGNHLIFDNTTIDGFEDGNYNEYTEYTEGNSYISIEEGTVYEGSYSVELAAETTSNNRNYADIYSQSGLPYYPRAGDTFSYRVYLGSNMNEGNTFFAFATQSGSFAANGYRIRINGQQTKVALEGPNGEITSQSATPPTSEWVRVVVNWQKDGTINATFYNESGSQWAYLSANDPTYEAGGIEMFAVGVPLLSSGSEMSFTYYDKIQIINGSREVSVTSDNSSIVEIDKENTSLVGKNVGEANITAQMSVGNSQISNSQTVTVRNATIWSADLNDIRQFEPGIGVLIVLRNIPYLLILLGIVMGAFVCRYGKQDDMVCILVAESWIAFCFAMGYVPMYVPLIGVLAIGIVAFEQ